MDSRVYLRVLFSIGLVVVITLVIYEVVPATPLRSVLNGIMGWFICWGTCVKGGKE